MDTPSKPGFPEWAGVVPLCSSHPTSVQVRNWNNTGFGWLHVPGIGTYLGSLGCLLWVLLTRLPATTFSARG